MDIEISSKNKPQSIDIIASVSKDVLPSSLVNWKLKKRLVRVVYL